MTEEVEQYIIEVDLSNLEEYARRFQQLQQAIADKRNSLRIQHNHIQTIAKQNEYLKNVQSVKNGNEKKKRKSISKKASE